MTPAVPARMQGLPRDARGLPIPVIVMWTNDGKPIFAANDEGRRQWCFEEDRCHICGGKLLRGRWFVSGPASALAEDGWMMDGPMHDECAHYALLACPYLAAPTYGRLVAAQQLARSDRKAVMLMPDDTLDNPRPNVFVAVMAVAQEYRRATTLRNVREAEFIRVVRPKLGAVRKVEFWRHGQQLTDAREIAATVVTGVSAQMPLRKDLPQ